MRKKMNNRRLMIASHYKASFAGLGKPCVHLHPLRALMRAEHSEGVAIRACDDFVGRLTVHRGYYGKNAVTGIG